jgi:hypothetical protein
VVPGVLAGGNVPTAWAGVLLLKCAECINGISRRRTPKTLTTTRHTTASTNHRGTVPPRFLSGERSLTGQLSAAGKGISLAAATVVIAGLSTTTVEVDSMRLRGGWENSIGLRVLTSSITVPGREFKFSPDIINGSTSVNGEGVTGSKA